MPKLNKALIKKVEAAEEVHGFSLITPGKYFARLREVRVEETRDKNPLWVCEFDKITPVAGGDTVPGRQWWRLNLPVDPNDVPDGRDPKKWATAQDLSAGRLKSFFTAFGYSEDSDTDEIINEVAVITIGIRTIKDGARAGEKVNDVTDIEPVDEYGDAPEFDDDDAAGESPDY